MADLAPAPRQQAQEPVFLRENWKLIMGYPKNRSYQRVVRVSSGTATIMHSAVMVRAPCAVPDGFYLLGEKYELILQDPSLWRGYPDPLGAWQPFEKMAKSPPLTPQMAASLVQYLEMLRSRKTTVVMDNHGLIPMQRHGMDAAGENRECFRFGFELPMGGQELVLDPFNLKLALIEMMRYDHFYLWHLNQLDRETPLVLGHSWDNCALVAPIR